tara:strand:+ start:2021 stop:2542 length:522 start_codon:yes stop_codon:yes gene_type:complete
MAQQITNRQLTAEMADNPSLLRAMTDEDIDMLIALIEMEEVEDEKNIGDHAAGALDMYGNVVQTAAPLAGAALGGTAGALAGVPTGGLGALAGTPTGIALGGGIGTAWGAGAKGITNAITEGVHQDRAGRTGDSQRKRFERLARIKAVQKKRLGAKEDRKDLKKHYSDLAGGF